MTIAEGIKAMQDKEDEEDDDYDDDQPLNIPRRVTRSVAAVPDMTSKIPKKKKAKPSAATAASGGDKKDNDKSGDCNRPQPPGIRQSAVDRGESLSDLVLNYCALLATFSGDASSALAGIEATSQERVVATYSGEAARAFASIEAASQEMCDEIVAAKERKARRKRKRDDKE